MCLAIGGVSFSEGLDFASARLVSLQSVLDPWMYPITRRQYRSGFEFLFHKIIHVCSCGIIKGPTTTLGELCIESLCYGLGRPAITLVCDIIFRIVANMAM